MQIPQTMCAALAAVAVAAVLPVAVGGQERFVTIDRFVPHTSTVPANEGERVGIYLREKATAAAVARFESGESPAGRVVLFVHRGPCLRKGSQLATVRAQVRPSRQVVDSHIPLQLD